MKKSTKQIAAVGALAGAAALLYLYSRGAKAQPPALGGAQFAAPIAAAIAKTGVSGVSATSVGQNVTLISGLTNLTKPSQVQAVGTAIATALPQTPGIVGGGAAGQYGGVQIRAVQSAIATNLGLLGIVGKTARPVY